MPAGRVAEGRVDQRRRGGEQRGELQALLVREARGHAHAHRGARAAVDVHQDAAHRAPLPRPRGAFAPAQWHSRTGNVIERSTVRVAPPSTHSRARLWP